MQVRIDRLDELEVELRQELDVAVDLFEDGIDDQRLAPAPAGGQIGIRTRYSVEHLAEDYALCPAKEHGSSSPLRSCFGINAARDPTLILSPSRLGDARPSYAPPTFRPAWPERRSAFLRRAAGGPRGRARDRI